MTIYIDVLFFQEFMMNMIILIGTGIILDNHISIKKVLFASSVGGISTIICLVLPVKLIGMVRIVFLLSVISLCYPAHSVMEWLKTVITFYFVTFVIAGISFYTIEEKVKRIIYLAAFTWIVTKLICSYKEKYRISHFTYSLEMKIEGKKYMISTFVDTGNFLTSCFDEDVILLSPNAVSKIQSKELKKILQGCVESKNKYQEKIRSITYESLGNPLGMKYGIKLDDVILIRGKERVKKEAVIIMGDINFKNYDSIVGLKFIERSEGTNHLLVQ